MLGGNILIDDYIKNPKSVRALSKELMKICDQYWTGNESEAVLKEYVNHVARHNKLLENNGKDINRSIRTIVGKRRVELVSLMLDGYQLQL